MEAAPTIQAHKITLEQKEAVLHSRGSIIAGHPAELLVCLTKTPLATHNAIVFGTATAAGRVESESVIPNVADVMLWGVVSPKTGHWTRMTESESSGRNHRSICTFMVQEYETNNEETVESNDTLLFHDLDMSSQDYQLMAVDLDKNRDALIGAWKEVVSNGSTNWALFGYEGQTNTLKFVSKGDGGLEEMAEDFSSGKIMYAFCRVLDPKTSLPKYVLINWQGEGAPQFRKGVCANHFSSIARFFKGSHVSINARTEDDVEASVIMEKVMKSTGSVYKFTEKTSLDESDSAPVGTSYKRVIPAREISISERDKFWQKEEEEEKQRQAEERKRHTEEQMKLEEERSKRELAEAKAREEKVKERTKLIRQQREAEKEKEKDTETKVQWEKQKEIDEQEEDGRRKQADLLRRQRAQETRNIISQRTVDARAVFEKNTSTGQLHSSRQNSVTSASPSYVSKVSQQFDYPSPRSPSNAVTSPTYIDSSVHTTASPAVSMKNEESYSEVHADPVLVTNDAEWTNQEVPDDAYSNAQHFVHDPGVVDENREEHTNGTEAVNGTGYTTEQYEGPTSFLQQYQRTMGQGLRARALFDYQAADETELSFDPDDIICQIDQIHEGWWQGLGPDGSYGLFPANYVELLQD
ncbi:unnamed protein product [Darwinula stevensoni]|uniref:Drebrin-like protein n=1 Tax=Darwinula stevensoni TaxID=69355 RepID=A0A7R8XAJ1_9CRUS|nr:unnamed protein product [Darwinula stevensoni]CAG0885614.1 unnamed protein product [Darwinula stevensoni]